MEHCLIILNIYDFIGSKSRKPFVQHYLQLIDYIISRQGKLFKYHIRRRNFLYYPGPKKRPFNKLYALHESAIFAPKFERQLGLLSCKISSEGCSRSMDIST